MDNPDEEKGNESRQQSCAKNFHKPEWSLISHKNSLFQITARGIAQSGQIWKKIPDQKT